MYVYVLIRIEYVYVMTFSDMCVGTSVSLISWTKKVHVDGQQQVELLPLLEQCTKEIADNHIDLYRDDLRYLRVWMQVWRMPRCHMSRRQARSISRDQTLYGPYSQRLDECYASLRV